MMQLTMIEPRPWPENSTRGGRWPGRVSRGDRPWRRWWVDGEVTSGEVLRKLVEERNDDKRLNESDALSRGRLRCKRRFWLMRPLDGYFRDLR
jgi:hypothetical protein